MPTHMQNTHSNMELMINLPVILNIKEKNVMETLLEVNIH
jgi:hypothetical protein